VNYNLEVWNSKIKIETYGTQYGWEGAVERGFAKGDCTKKEAEVLERFLLALACECVEIDSPAFVLALEATLEALANA
jgi:hypothetical protein